MARLISKKVLVVGLVLAALAVLALWALGGIHVSLRSSLPIVSIHIQPMHLPGDKASPLPASNSSSKTLFSDKLSGPDRILTNEYAYWGSSQCPYKSSSWEMTSGTLLIKNDAGYSGVPTREEHSVCESSEANNSSIFRLNTKDYSFGNTKTSMDYMLVKHGGGGAQNSSYDGMHIWARYQSQYALYTVTLARWDGVIVIKKKVPVEVAHCSNPSNDGCYYELSNEIKRTDLVTPGVWRHAEVIATDTSSNSVRLTLLVDGKVVLQADDRSVHGPIYRNGAVGVRGDNTEFYFKNFTVTKT